MEGFDRSLAFIVAIDNYTDGVPRLRTPVADAKALAKCVSEDHGFDTELILDSAATLTGLRAFLSDLLNRIGNNDRVLFYFAGHGTAVDSDKGPTGYILPQDAKLDSDATFLPMLELNAALSALPCRHMLLILDCCFAGAFQWATTRHLALGPEHLHQERYKWFISDPAWQAIASAAHDEAALDVAAGRPLGTREDHQGHSPFAAALVEGLKGAADRSAKGQAGDGVITATELYQHLVDALLPRKDGDFRQTPICWPLRKLDKGQYVFLVPGTELDLPPAPPLDPDANPWRGLDTYDEKDKDLFYGRRAAADRLAKLLLDGVATSHQNAIPAQQFVAVTGPSGIGKSSLVKAGLIPRLKDVLGNRLIPILVRPSKPGPTPFVSLAEALAAASLDGVSSPDANALMSNPDALADWIRQIDGVDREVMRTVLLVIDQAHELITASGGPDSASRFNELIERALKASKNLIVIFTVRSEFESLFEQSPLRDRWTAAVYPVPQMTQDELRRVIEGPAAVKVMRFESPDLVEALVNEVANMPGALPALSFALSQMYRSYLDRRVTDRSLGWSDYEALGGGVKGLLRLRADRIIDEGGDAQRAVARRVLERLVSTEADEFTRRRVPRWEFDVEDDEERALIEHLLKRLDEELLIVTDEVHGARYLELAHDALIIGWQRLREWMTQDSARIAVLRTLTADVKSWRSSSKARSGLLWTDAAGLADIWNLRSAEFPGLNRDELAFAIASHAQAIKTRAIRISSSSIVLAAAAAAALWWNANLRVTTEYCADYVSVWGEPSCIGSLDAGLMQKRSFSFRIKRQGGHVLQWARINGLGQPTDNNLSQFEVEDDSAVGAALMDFDPPDREGLASRVTLRSVTGQEIRKLTYQFGADRKLAVVSFSKGLGMAEGQLAGGTELSGKVSDETRTAIGQHRLFFDGSGFITKRIFEPSGEAVPIADSLGSYGQTYVRNPVGQVVEIRNLGSDATPIVDPKGVSALLERYDPHGRVDAIQWVDEHGDPIQNDTGFASVHFDYDDSGNVTTSSYFDGNDEPTSRSDTGSAIFTTRYDEHGNIVETANHAANGALIASKKERAAGSERTYDNKGRLTELAYFGVDRKPTTGGESGAARVSLRYDDRGNAIGLSYLGIDGKPVLHKKWGVATIKREYDKDGNRVTEQYFDLDGQRILDADGQSAIVSSKYDERGNETEVTYLDGNYNLTINKKFGASTIKRKFDLRGNLSEESYFGTDGLPITSKSPGAAARITYRYNERGNFIEQATYGVDGRPAVDITDGTAKTTYSYDEHGNATDESYFGVDGQPTLDKNWGVARIVRTFDAQSNETVEAYFGTSGKPVFAKAGGAAAKITFQYDKHRNQIGQAYFGIDGEPVLDLEDGIAGISYLYDARGNETEKAFFGIDGKPSLDRQWGIARMVRSYDDRGNIKEESYFGADGSPIVAKTEGAAARVTFKYNDRDQKIERNYFDSNGDAMLATDLGVARIASTYDGRGNEVETSYFGVKGEPILHKRFGAAVIRRRYDVRDNEIEESYLGNDGRPISPKINGQAALLKFRYDRHDRQIECSYFGVDGRPTTSSESGAAKVVYQYDGRGRQTYVGYLDVSGRPKEHVKWHLAGIQKGYDQRGNLTSEAYVGRDGKPVVDPELGVAKITRSYDGNDQEIEESYFSVDGNPAPHVINGAARIQFAYDERGRYILKRYFGVTGSPMLSTNFGTATAAFRYDERGNQVEQTYFGLDGEPVVEKDHGAARVSMRFDERGQEVERLYFSKDGVPVVAINDGAAKITRRFDNLGNKVEEEYFGVDGKPMFNSVVGAARIVFEYDSSQIATKETRFDQFGKIIGSDE